MVFYLKYRPQKFSELSSENVRETLEAVLSSRKSSFHAFLFTGPKGLGKTSTARIVAKFLNCEKRKAGDLEPCNKCYQCTSIQDGNSLDVLEIDAASNRGIDEIRTLRDQVKLATAGGKFRVYIIDEVHMLTNEAFNALLKTLEEPPSHVVFILCTTEPHKVPATIASRCLNVQFKKATPDELVHSLKRIVSGEKLNADKDALFEIAKISDGSFRDAAKILQELSSRGRKISRELVEKNLKLQIANYTEGLRNDLLNRETKHALELISEMEKQGIEFKFFTEQFIETLHNELILQVIENKTGEFPAEELKSLIEIMVKAHQELKYAIIPQLPLELVVVEWGLNKKPEEVILPKAQDKQEAKSVDENNFLQELIVRVNTQNHPIAGLLRGVILGKISEKKITLKAKYKFHKEKLEDQKTLGLIEGMASEILGKNVTINIELGGV